MTIWIWAACKLNASPNASSMMKSAGWQFQFRGCRGILVFWPAFVSRVLVFRLSECFAGTLLCWSIWPVPAEIPFSARRCLHHALVDESMTIFSRPLFFSTSRPHSLCKSPTALGVASVGFSFGNRMLTQLSLKNKFYMSRNFSSGNNAMTFAAEWLFRV